MFFVHVMYGFAVVAVRFNVWKMRTLDTSSYANNVNRFKRDSIISVGSVYGDNTYS